jgi:hypothetical protein
MEEALIRGEVAFMADEETTEVTQVSKGAFDLPAFVIAPQRAAILQGGAAAPTAMGTDQLDPACGQPLAKTLRVVRAVTDEPGGTSARATGPGPRDLDRAQGFFREGDFRGRSAKESASQRYTRAVCHHHPLCTFTTFGFTHAEPPFLALAKLPSMKTSSQLSLPWASSAQRKTRQMLSQMSSSSQLRKRRQQVLALG